MRTLLNFLLNKYQQIFFILKYKIKKNNRKHQRCYFDYRPSKIWKNFENHHNYTELCSYLRVLHPRQKSKYETEIRMQENKNKTLTSRHSTLNYSDLGNKKYIFSPGNITRNLSNEANLSELIPFFSFWNHQNVCSNYINSLKFA